jgi:hypothetical protein
LDSEEEYIPEAVWEVDFGEDGVQEAGLEAAEVRLVAFPEGEVRLAVVGQAEVGSIKIKYQEYVY